VYASAYHAGEARRELPGTKVQALGCRTCREDMPLTIKVQGQDVMVVEEFVYLASLIHSTTGSM